MNEYYRKRRVERLLLLLFVASLAFICVLVYWPQPEPPPLPTRTPRVTATHLPPVTSTPVDTLTQPVHTATITLTHVPITPSATPLEPTLEPSATWSATPTAAVVVRVPIDREYGCERHPLAVRCWRRR